MKRLTLLVLLALIAISCCGEVADAQPVDPAKVTTVALVKETSDARKYATQNIGWSTAILVFELEDCEYIQNKNHIIIHKANCKNPDHKVVTTRVDSIYVIIQPDGTKTIQRDWGWK